MPLGIVFKNENVNEEMLLLLKQFHTYLPKKWNGQYDVQLFAGDQLSIERAANVISSVANGYSPEDRLEGIHLQLGDWHACVKLLTVSTGKAVLFLEGEKEEGCLVQNKFTCYFVISL